MPSTMAQAPSVPQGEQSVSGLTATQVCDLPLDELLSQLNSHIVITEINEPGFFGYVTVHTSGRFVIHLPSRASELKREVAIRYFVTVHLGLPTHHFPRIVQHTVFDGAGNAIHQPATRAAA